MDNIFIAPGKLSGEVFVPKSKSIAHRRIILSALAGGNINLLKEDELSADLSATKKGIADILAGESEIFCGESGSTLRFLIPIAAAMGKKIKFTGEGRLPKRPLDEYVKTLSKKGISFTLPKESGNYLPLEMEGTLKTGRFIVAGDISSQYITGLMLSLPLLDGDSIIEVKGKFESKAYVDITLDVIKNYGVQINSVGNEYHIPGNQKYLDVDFPIEGDYSQGAFWLTANYLGSNIKVKGLPQETFQADGTIIDILRNYKDMSLSRSGCGCCIECPVVQIDVSQIPDLVPIICVAASASDAVTVITGARRLRYKESDRILSSVMLINSIGGDAKIKDDGIIINGCSIQKPGGKVQSFGDHRIVMASAIAALDTKDGITITGHQCVSKSYPRFFEDFVNLQGEINEFNSR